MKKILFIFILYTSNIYSQEDSIWVEIRDDAVVIWNTQAQLQCCAEIKMNVEITGDSIIVVEKDTSFSPCDCICYFDLYISLIGLQSDYYTAFIYRIGYSGDTSLTYIGSVEFFIPPSSNLLFSERFYQSDCYFITDIKDSGQPSNEYQLINNYPNPFNSTTNIQYTVPGIGNGNFSPLQLKVYNIYGQEVATLVNEVQRKGIYKISFDAVELSSGVYYYKLQSGSYKQVRKMVLLK
jgi:hypothetical protein